MKRANTSQLLVPTTDEKTALKRFAHLEIDLETLRRELKRGLTFDFRNNPRTLSKQFDWRVAYIPITKVDVDRARAKETEGFISQQQLSDWATMLLMNEMYDWQGADEDEIAEKLNDLSFSTL
jgi:hypothetical protein